MSDKKPLTIEQKWQLLHSWAQTLANHAKAKDAYSLTDDLVEVTAAVQLVIDDPKSREGN